MMRMVLLEKIDALVLCKELFITTSNRIKFDIANENKQKKIIWVLEREDISVVRNAFILKYLQVNVWSSPIPEVTRGKNIRIVLIKMDQT